MFISVRTFAYFFSWKWGGAGPPGGPRPIDKKNLDFLTAFLELDRGNSSRTPTVFRVGQQELQFGAGRLVAVREGPNVRQGFYGGRITQRLNRWTLDAFAVRPAKDDPGFLDSVPLQTTSFWAIHSQRALGGGPATVADFYYFGLDRKSATFQQRHRPRTAANAGCTNRGGSSATR
jgi:hypothetical protein